MTATAQFGVSSKSMLFPELKRYLVWFDRYLNGKCASEKITNKLLSLSYWLGIYQNYIDVIDIKQNSGNYRTPGR